MQIRSPYEVPSVQGISEGARNFSSSLRTQLGVLKKRVLTARVDNHSQALPIT